MIEIDHPVVIVAWTQMPRITVERTVPVPVTDAWDAISDLSSHTKWMRDAHSIEFETESTTGVGTRMVVDTRIGPLRTIDRMNVTEWVEGSSITVEHVGIVTGLGTLSVTEDVGGALVTWEETLRFPLWLGGAVTAWLARPILTAVWRGNLRRLEDLLSSP